ncbi:uncharacterized protein LOC135334629 [Halichondria panicea]|uniref:uncharacterized protein LOC135334629 n=1 Tax=Halichondria panicea TaxID=6063 RepID=UPI00312B6026
MALRVKEISAAKLPGNGRLFVVISFEGKERRTTTRRPLMSLPTSTVNWLEEFVFPLKEPLQTSSTQSLKFDLYQEFNVRKSATINSHKFIGTLDIPPLGLLRNGRYQSPPLSLKNDEGKSLMSTVSVTVEYDPPSSPAKEINDGSLTLGEASAALCDVRARWFDLGLELHLPFRTLEDIVETHHTSEDRLTAMLRKRLQSSPNPTWSVVVKALRSRVINRPDIADEIEVKYIKSDDFSMQETIDTAASIKEQLKYVHKLNELLRDKKNTINLRYLKLYLIGLSGLGKTTFRKRLLGHLFNLASISPQDRKRCSTLLAECTQVLAVSSDSKLILKASTDILTRKHN